MVQCFFLIHFLMYVWGHYLLEDPCPDTKTQLSDTACFTPKYLDSLLIPLPPAHIQDTQCPRQQSNPKNITEPPLSFMVGMGSCSFL